MERLSDEIRSQLSRFGAAAGLAELVGRWPEAVGEQIAQNAWPARVGRDGTLHVATADAVWAFELGQRAAQIAERLGVPRVRFAPGPLPRLEPARAERRLPPATPDQVEAARAIAGRIEDENLRESVQKAVLSGLRAGAEVRPT